MNYIKIKAVDGWILLESVGFPKDGKPTDTNTTNTQVDKNQLLNSFVGLLDEVSRVGWRWKIRMFFEK